MKMSNTYDQLSKGLQNIIDEVKEIKSITVGKLLHSVFFLEVTEKF